MDEIAVSIASSRADACVLEHVRRLLDLGFDRLGLHRSLRRSEWVELEGFVRRGAFVSTWLFAPLPDQTGSGAGELRPPRVGSVDADERREAIKSGTRSIEFADLHDIEMLLVPPVTLEAPGHDEVRSFLEKNPPDDLRDAFLATRASSAAVREQLDSYLRFLEPLLETAARYERRLVVVAAGFPHELPARGELEVLLREFSGAPLSIASDMIRVECAERFRREFSGAGRVALGDGDCVLVNDGDLDVGKQPLGEGIVQEERWRASGPPSERSSQGAAETRVTWLIDISRELPIEALVETAERLRALLGLAGPDIVDGALVPYPLS